jgi:hypothetical protein
MQAVKDYRVTLQDLKQDPVSTNALHAMNELEKFFRSEWYASLTTINGEMLMEKLRREVV